MVQNMNYFFIYYFQKVFHWGAWSFAKLMYLLIKGSIYSIANYL